MLLNTWTLMSTLNAINVLWNPMVLNSSYFVYTKHTRFNSPALNGWFDCFSF